jgi:hypothetical protein
MKDRLLLLLLLGGRRRVVDGMKMRRLGRNLVE